MGVERAPLVQMPSNQLLLYVGPRSAAGTPDMAAMLTRGAGRGIGVREERLLENLAEGWVGTKELTWVAAVTQHASNRRQLEALRSGMMLSQLRAYPPRWHKIRNDD